MANTIMGFCAGLASGCVIASIFLWMLSNRYEKIIAALQKGE